MPITLGPFFEIIVLRSEVDSHYPGGSSALRAEIGSGMISDDFLLFGSMGSDNTIDEVTSKLSKAGMNCDDDSLECVYVISQFKRIRNKSRSWLKIIPVDGQNIELHLKHQK